MGPQIDTKGDAMAKQITIIGAVEFLHEVRLCLSPGGGVRVR